VDELAYASCRRAAWINHGSAQSALIAHAPQYVP
jgi:hypothetical protein